MAEGEEDFSSLPLPDRFSHKVKPPLLDVFGQLPSMTQNADNLLNISRIGKCERKDMKMPSNSLKRHPTSRIQFLYHFYKIQVSGKGQCQIPM
jgi:hypothetical protein